MTKPLVLDCSLRDGGYYNIWDFPPALVTEYLATMAAIPVDVVEIGLRGFADGTFKGAHAFSTDDYLRSLPLPEGITLGVMVDAKTLLAHPDGPVAACSLLFAPRAESPVGLVRVATHVREMDNLGPTIERLSALGYRVGLNIMQAGSHPSETLTNAARLASRWPLEVLYFADSLGNMDPPAIAAVYDALRAGWPGAIGIHTHNNMMNALANSMAAIDMGVSWVDGTVLGIGRGAGNVPLEFLLLEIARRHRRHFELARLVELIDDHFAPYQRQYGWGPDPLYYLAAQYSIHPTYVQMMKADPRYSGADILETLTFFKSDTRHSYRADVLDTLMLNSAQNGDGSWLATNWAEGGDVLLVAPGPSVTRYCDALIRFIERHRPLTIALNVSCPLPQDLVSAYATCHPQRIHMDAQRFLTLDRPLVAPMAQLPAPMHKPLAERATRDYGMTVVPQKFAFGPMGCILPRPLVAAYGLALATAGGAGRILLAGFDGFDPSDPRQAEMVEVLELYQRHPDARPLLALTPTSYAVPQSSIFAPIP